MLVHRWELIAVLLLTACSPESALNGLRRKCDDGPIAVTVKSSAGKFVVNSGSRLDAKEDAQWRQTIGLPKLTYPLMDKSYADAPYLNMPMSAVEKFQEGWLVGTDAGEWGGGLYFLQPRKPAQELKIDRVFALLPSGDKIHVVFGLMHMGENRGSYGVVSKAADGKVIFTESARLPGAPMGARRNGDTLTMWGITYDPTKLWARTLRGGALETTKVTAVSCAKNQL